MSARYLYVLLSFSSNFLVNSADRVIRVFDLDLIMEAQSEEDMEPLQKLQDLVNRWVWLNSCIIIIITSPSPFCCPPRTQWRKCTFSGDGEFIVAGSHRQHELYIWDKATGSLVKMLTGQKGETLLDIAVSVLGVCHKCLGNGNHNCYKTNHLVLECKAHLHANFNLTSSLLESTS